MHTKEIAMKKAIIYARQSSGSESASESIEVQILNCKNLAEKMNLELLGIFHDHNISGKTYPAGFEAVANLDQAFLNWFTNQTGHKKFRDGLGSLMEKLPQTDFLIVDEITRLYRPLSNSFLESFINQKLIINGVQILQVKGGILDLALFDQHLITMLKNQINDEQIAKQRQKSIEVMAKIRDNGFLPTGPKAWGLEYDKQTKKISMSAEKAAVIILIFESILNNIPYNQIILTINKDFASLLEKNFWTSAFYNIAKNPIYCGYQFNTNGELIKNKQWDGVISYETFEAVQKIMQKKRIHDNKHHVKPRTNRFLPLSGYIFCGNCSSRLVAGISSNKIYYRCPNANLHKNTACSKNRIAESINSPSGIGLKEAVYYYFRFFLQQECAKSAQNFLSETEKNISEQLQDFNDKQNLFAHAFINGELALSEYNKYMKSLNKKIWNLKNKDNSISINVFSAIYDLYHKYLRKKITDSEYEYLLKNTFNKITVYNDTVIFDTKFGIFERNRKIIKRQKGVSIRNKM